MTEIQYPPGAELTPENGNINTRPGNGSFSIHDCAEKTSHISSQDHDRGLQQIVFDEAIEIACDWFEATGGEPISQEAFQNLYNNGYASNIPSKVLDIFYDWKDYLTVAKSYYEERQDPETIKGELVESLRKEAAIGIVPPEIFKKAESYKIVNPSGKKKLVRYRLTEELAANDVILQRYFKYLVADYVTKNRDSKDEITHQRKLNIALGFTLEAEKPLSSFYGELKKSNASLDEEQLMLAIEELGAYEYIYPESRKVHLKQLLDAGSPLPPPEYYYDLKTNKVLVLGRTALSQFAGIEGGNYLDWLNKQKMLTLGDRATNAVDKHKLDKDKIRPLISLLADQNFTLEGHGENRNKYRSWGRELYLEYGRWLMNLVDLDASTLTRAHRLGLGPGSDAFSSPKRFGSLTQYFSELGFTNRIPKGKMDDLDPSAIIDHIKKVAELNDGKVTTGLLKDYYQSQAIKTAPSIYILSKLTNGRLSELVEAAGFRVHNKKYGAEGCLDMVKEFIQNEHKVPTAKDFDKSPSLPSRPTIYRYFGDLQGLKTALKKEMVAA